MHHFSVVGRSRSKDLLPRGQHLVLNVLVIYVMPEGTPLMERNSCYMQVCLSIEVAEKIISNPIPFKSISQNIKNPQDHDTISAGFPAERWEIPLKSVKDRHEIFRNMSLIKLLKPCVKLVLNKTVISDNFVSNIMCQMCCLPAGCVMSGSEKWDFRFPPPYYRLQTKSQESNVFTGVCSQGRGKWHTSWDRSHGRVPPPPPRHQVWEPSPPYYWHLVVITGDLFKLVHLRIYPSPQQYWHLVVATETCTVGKQAVRILLECCLVSSLLSIK